MRLSPETCRVKPLRIKNAIVASCWTYFTNISQKSFEKYSNINFMKIRPVGADFFVRTDAQTDMTKLIGAFRKFAKAAKIA